MRDASNDLLDPLLNHLSNVGGSGLIVSSGGIRPRMHVDGEVISIEDCGPIRCNELLSSLHRIREALIENSGRFVYELNGHLFTIRSWTDTFGTTAVIKPVEWIDDDNEA